MSKKTLAQIANSIARQHGYGTATSVKIGISLEVRHTRYGYRKVTTGQYVPNKYRSNFGWKNTYYQPALTEVTIPVHIAQKATDWPTIAAKLGEGC